MMHHLNRFVMHNIGSSVFYFTMIAARLDRTHRSLEFANAGHPPAMIVQPGQAPRLLESGSAVLGLLEDAVGKDATIIVPVQSGDRLVIYTDGFSETFNEQRDMLGVEGLSEIVRETSTLPLNEMKEQILQRVAAFRHGPPDDDMSLVLIEIP
jgi:serine phosphatase RsbU (regulator of sigma subunit)